MCQPGLTQTAGKTESSGPRICWETWVKGPDYIQHVFQCLAGQQVQGQIRQEAEGWGGSDLKTLTHLWGRGLGEGPTHQQEVPAVFYTCQGLEIGQDTWGLRGSREQGGRLEAETDNRA